MTSNNGKVAIVTGGGSGIGRATALTFSKKGYAVSISGRTEESLMETINLAGENANIMAVKSDVGNPDSVKELFSETIKKI
jgi:NAD(P)-dependent dehydrogenase (short-subunit alcohol dehydrogenase family)